MSRPKSSAGRLPVSELPPPPNTARELLEAFGGPDHRLHSVSGRRYQVGGTVSLVCSCGEEFRIAALAQHMAALRNVSEK